MSPLAGNQSAYPSLCFCGFYSKGK